MTSGVGILLTVAAAATSTYVAKIEAKDGLGNTAAYEATIPTDSVAFHIREGGQGAAFGKYAEEDDLLDVAWAARIRKALRLDVPLGAEYGGTGASTASEAVQNLFAVGSYATSYPTKPGIYRTIGTNIFQNMTPYSSYGVLMIFKAAYAAHFYIDATGTLYYGYSGDTFAEPTKWYTPSVTQKT